MAMDFSNPVVLALHYQNEVLHPEGRFAFGTARNAEMRDRVVATARELHALARSRGWPIVHVRIAYRPDHADVVRNCAIFRKVVAEGLMGEGSWGADWLEELRPQPRAAEFTVTHNRVNAFHASTLEDILRMLAPSALIVGGVATNSVVEHSVRHATDLGFESLVVEDACGAADAEFHEAALRNLRLVAEVGSLQELAAHGGSS